MQSPVAVAEAVPWRDAWEWALYGERGFYRAGAGPAAHFATSSHAVGGPIFAEALLELARRVGATHLVDLGAGRGELLTRLDRLAAPELRLTGLDVVDRPRGLGERIGWASSPGGGALPDALTELVDEHTIVVANEWLDVVPCDVVEQDESGAARVVLVTADGVESLGPTYTDPEGLAWLTAHVPGFPTGDWARAEVGLTRDLAWAQLTALPGWALAVDYGTTAEDRRATLTGYRRGRQEPPVPDGRTDITAHVAVDSLPGGQRLTQREALSRLGIRPELPSAPMPESDPAAYVADLMRTAHVAALTRRGGLGDFVWVLAGPPGADLPW